MHLTGLDRVGWPTAEAVITVAAAVVIGDPIDPPQLYNSSPLQRNTNSARDAGTRGGSPATLAAQHIEQNRRGWIRMPGC